MLIGRHSTELGEISVSITAIITFWKGNIQKKLVEQIRGACDGIYFLNWNLHSIGMIGWEGFVNEFEAKIEQKFIQQDANQSGISLLFRGITSCRSRYCKSLFAPSTIASSVDRQWVSKRVSLGNWRSWYPASLANSHPSLYAQSSNAWACQN